MKNLLACCVIAFSACRGEGDDSPEPTDAGAPECLHDSDCSALSETRVFCDTANGLTDDDNRCAICLAATSREGLIFDVGCKPGEECIDDRCVAVTCADADECPPTRPLCHQGSCLECETDADCPFHREDECLDVSCWAGACVAETVCDCSEDADCNDGNSCTTDLCHVSGACRHEPQPNCPTASAAGGSGGDSTPSPAGTITANCTWTPPTGTGTFSSATMSMAVAGGPLTTLCTQSAGAAVTCTRTGLSPGQTLDVSVEYVAGGTASWSCVGNGASGSSRGTLSCGLSTGATLSSWLPVANGLSSGCNLRATIAS